MPLCVVPKVLYLHFADGEACRLIREGSTVGAIIDIVQIPNELFT